MVSGQLRTTRRGPKASPTSLEPSWRFDKENVSYFNIQDEGGQSRESGASLAFGRAGLRPALFLFTLGLGHVYLTGPSPHPISPN